MGEVHKIEGFDISGEDDNLISSSPDDFLNHQFSENRIEQQGFELSDPVEAINVAENFRQNEELLQPSESLEPEKTRKSGKCNLRKSLAWDTAFFTNAGVLDAEELSSMIGGNERVKHVLPGIQEDDLQRSVESISTLDSDSLTLENLEADLFQDIRASIQKSSKAPRAANSTATARSKENGPQPIHSSNKVVPASRNKASIKPASSKLNVSSQGSGKMVKSSVCPEITQKRPAARNIESTSSIPKVPKALGKVTLIPASPAKRASLVGSNRVKTEISNVAVRGASLPKAPGSCGSRSVVPRPTISSKSPSTRRFSTTANAEPNTSTSSIDSSTSSSSVNVVRTNSSSVKGKIGSKVSNPLTSGPTPKTPARIRPKNKTEPGNSHLSDYVMSSTRKSSSISPASSISEWSCESSSSTSTVNLRSSISKASMATSSPHEGSVENDHHALNIQKQANGQTLGGQKSQATRLSSQFTTEALTAGTSTLSCQAAAKPSGLRMPSPKIGFFDGVKSLVRTPKGDVKPPGGSLKFGGSCSPSGKQNSAKLKKFQSAKPNLEIQGDELSRMVGTPINPSLEVQKEVFRESLAHSDDKFPIDSSHLTIHGLVSGVN